MTFKLDKRKARKWLREQVDDESMIDEVPMDEHWDPRDYYDANTLIRLLDGALENAVITTDVMQHRLELVVLADDENAHDAAYLWLVDVAYTDPGGIVEVRLASPRMALKHLGNDDAGEQLLGVEAGLAILAEGVKVGNDMLKRLAAYEG